MSLHDREGRLIIKTTRSKNRLYKVTLQVDTQVRCLQAKTSDIGSLWHDRLGHINSETIRRMVDKELVEGLPTVKQAKETCVSCLRGKQSRKSFPQATNYRASSSLELVHTDPVDPLPLRPQDISVISLC